MQHSGSFHGVRLVPKTQALVIDDLPHRSLEFAWTTNMAIRPKPLTQRPIALDGPLSISICHARAACLPCEDLLKLLEVHRVLRAKPRVSDCSLKYPTLQHMPSMCFQQYTPLIALLAENSLTGLELNVQHLQTLLGETQFDPLAFIDVALAVCWQWKEATSSEGRKTAADVRHDEDGAKNIAHLGKMICAISSLKIDEGFRYLYAPRYVLGAHVIYSTTAFEDSGSRYFRQEAADLLLPRAVREDPSDAEDPSETEDSDSQSDWSDDEEGPSEHWKLIPEWNLEDILRPTHSLTVDQLYYLPWSLVTLEWRRPPLDTKKRTEHERDSESTAFLQYHGEWLRTLSRQLQTHPVLHRGPVPTYSGVRRKSAVLPKLF